MMLSKMGKLKIVNSAMSLSVIWDLKNSHFSSNFFFLEIHQRFEEERESWLECRSSLEQKLNNEIMLKKQSVNKLVQVMTRKPQVDEKDTGKGASRRALKVKKIYKTFSFYKRNSRLILTPKYFFIFGGQKKSGIFSSQDLIMKF